MQEANSLISSSFAGGYGNFEEQLKRVDGILDSFRKTQDQVQQNADQMETVSILIKDSADQMEKTVSSYTGELSDFRRDFEARSDDVIDSFKSQSQQLDKELDKVSDRIQKIEEGFGSRVQELLSASKEALSNLETVRDDISANSAGLQEMIDKTQMRSEEFFGQFKDRMSQMNEYADACSKSGSLH